MRHHNRFCPLCLLRNPFHRDWCAKPPPAVESEPTGLEAVSRPGYEVTS